jgi:hypothetical protein
MTLDGTWRCRGYGRTLVVDGPDVRWFDTTTVSRIAASRTTLEELRREYGSIVREGDRLSLVEACGITRYDFDRAPPLEGDAIRAGNERDAVTNFRVFWQTFAENYAFFEARAADWTGVGDRLAGRLGPLSTEDDLQAVLAEAIGLLGDPHVVLRADELGIRSAGESTGSLRAWWRREAAGDGDASNAFLDGMRCWVETEAGLRDAIVLAGGQLVAGYLPDGVGYLALLRMNRWAHDGDGCANVAAAVAAIDRALQRLDRARAMVVDVRFNGGGWDAVGLAIAARFADRERVAFSKQARDGDGWTEPQFVRLTPPPGQQFTGPTALLISPSTASAAEVFTLAMRELPHVTVIGSRSQGILSDELDKVLPNGWRMTLSNELYRAPDGAIYEAVGIPPDVDVEPEPGERLGDHLRHGLDRALQTVDADVAGR